MLSWLYRRKNDRWIFLHIPKSAGRWIQTVIPELNKSLEAELFSGIPQHYLYPYNRYCGLDGSIDNGALKKVYKKHGLNNTYTFCSIRDPFQWYLSFYIWSHAIGSEIFIKHNYVPYYNTFKEFILDGKVTYIGAVRPHLNACNSYVRLASLKDDFKYLISTAFPEKIDAFDDAVFEKKVFNNLNNIPNEKQRKALDDSEFKKRFAAYIEGKETDCFYTEEMKDAIWQRDDLILRLLELEHPVINLDNKLSDFSIV